MTITEKVNEARARIHHLNYRLNNDPRDRQYVEEWIDELKEELASEDTVYIDMYKTMHRGIVKGMMLDARGE